MPAGRPKKDPADVDYFAIQVLTRYRKGMSAEDIATELRCDHWTVHAAIRAAAQECREYLRDDIEETFLQQKIGLEHLVRRCFEAVEKAAAAGQFDDRAVKALIMVYDRQGKLLGMDRGGAQAGKDGYAWMHGAGEAELRKRAKDLGIRLPEPIHDA